MIKKAKKEKLTKSFSFKPVHIEFFNDKVSTGSGSFFMQQLIEKSDEFKQWKEKE